jgi:poly-gamma-glutamate synthesis protein (capsule biosynthesis protein)
MVFNAPPAMLDSLAGLGFDAVSFANNHVYDQGRGGFIETLDRLDEVGVAAIGAGRTCAEAYAPRRFDLDGIQVAFLGGTLVFNDALNAGEDRACAAMLKPERVIAEAVRARREGADVVLLSAHWGVEYDTAPQSRQIRIAHQLIEGGVDGIIGHHPHVLQPIEVVETEDGRRGVIVYSLGNFVSNQSAWYQPGLHAPDQADPRDGVLLSMRVVKRRYGRGERTVVRTELTDVVSTPLWTVNNTARTDSRPTHGLAPVEIRVVPTRDRMVALDAALAEATDEGDIVRLSRERTEMDTRWRRVGGIVGERFLPPLR